MRFPVPEPRPRMCWACCEGSVEVEFASENGRSELASLIRWMLAEMSVRPTTSSKRRAAEIQSEAD